MHTHSLNNNCIAGFFDGFHSQKSLAERAFVQLSDQLLRQAPDHNTNSVAVIIKHVAGNLRSRFTDFLTTDGEKPSRNRDAEFIDTYADRAHILQDWESGWTVLFAALETLGDQHLDWNITIRGEPHTVAAALARALAHAGYHTGQIVLTARLLSQDQWQTITVPKGGSHAFNAHKGYHPTQASPQGFGPRR